MAVSTLERPSTLYCSIYERRCSAVPIWCWRPGIFWDSHWSLIHTWNPEDLMEAKDDRSSNMNGIVSSPAWSEGRQTALFPQTAFYMGHPHSGGGPVLRKYFWDMPSQSLPGPPSPLSRALSHPAKGMSLSLLLIKSSWQSRLASQFHREDNSEDLYRNHERQTERRRKSKKAMTFVRKQILDRIA